MWLTWNEKRQICLRDLAWAKLKVFMKSQLNFAFWHATLCQNYL